MTSTDRYRLGVMHHRLDAEIRAEVSRRIPDLMRLRRLKVLKLAVKDRLAGAWAHAPQPA